MAGGYVAERLREATKALWTQDSWRAGVHSMSWEFNQYTWLSIYSMLHPPQTCSVEVVDICRARVLGLLNP